MAFPTGWNRKCALTISSSMVSSGSLSDFPLLLTEDTLPSEMFDSDGSYPAQSDGEDIRFSSDSAGSSQLACEVVSITTDPNPANGTAEIWVKVPSVTASGDTTIYVWYNTAGTTSKESDGGTYGRNAVWSGSYSLVAHLEDAATESSGRTSWTNNGATSAAGAFGGSGGAQYFDGSADYIACDDTTSNWVHADIDAGLYISAWVRPEGLNGDNSQHRIIGGVQASGNTGYASGGIYILDGGSWQPVRAEIYDGGYKAATPSATYDLDNATWYLVGAVVDASSNLLYSYHNGVQAASTAINGTYAWLSANLVDIGRRCGNASEYFEGRIDEARVRIGDVPTTSWIAAEYANQSAPATYITAGTPADTGGGGGATPKGPLGLPFNGPFAGAFA